MKAAKIEFQDKKNTILIWNLSIGSALSWELAKFSGSDFPYLAPLTVILCLQSTIDKTVNLSIKRFIGTVIGEIVTLLVVSYLPVNGWNLGLIILLGCFITKYLKLDKKVIHQVAITILLVFVFEQKTKTYAIDRLKDTLIGVLIAGLIQLVMFRLMKGKRTRYSQTK